MGGLPKSHTKAHQLFQEAAEEGYVPALYELGEYYATSHDGLEPNYTKAREYYEMAAQKGNLLAKNALSSLRLKERASPADVPAIQSPVDDSTIPERHQIELPSINSVTFNYTNAADVPAIQSTIDASTIAEGHQMELHPINSLVFHYTNYPKPIPDSRSQRPLTDLRSPNPIAGSSISLTENQLTVYKEIYQFHVVKADGKKGVILYPGMLTESTGLCLVTIRKILGILQKTGLISLIEEISSGRRGPTTRIYLIKPAVNPKDIPTQQLKKIKFV
jgi:hypothetical protein